MPGWLEVANALQAQLRVAVTGPGFPNVKVYPGWPEPNTLLRDLKITPLGTNTHISLYPYHRSRRVPSYLNSPSGYVRNTTVEITLRNTVTKTVAFSGTGVVGDNVFIFINNRGFGTTIIAGDTNLAIATRLATSINNLVALGVTAGVSGSTSVCTITLAGIVYDLASRTFGQVTYCEELTRTQRDMMATIWAPDPETRELVANAVIGSIAGSSFVDVGDSSVRVIFDGDEVSDLGLPSGILRQDVFVMLEYATTRESTAPVVACPVLDLAVFFQGFLSAQQFSGNPFANGGVESMNDHIHIHEVPSGARPGQQFVLSYIPMVGTVRVMHGLIGQQAVALSPGINQFTINAAIINLGNTVQVGEPLWVDYEVAR